MLELGFHPFSSCRRFVGLESLFKEELEKCIVGRRLFELKGFLGNERRVVLGLLSVCALLFSSFLTHHLLSSSIISLFIPSPFVLVVMVRCGSFSEEGYYIKFLIPFK
jgi:hypothetical protein